MPHVEIRIGWMQGAVRRQGSFPCQAMQRRKHRSWSQPGGSSAYGRMAVLRLAHLEQPNFAPRALPCIPQAGGVGHDFRWSRL